MFEHHYALSIPGVGMFQFVPDFSSPNAAELVRTHQDELKREVLSRNLSWTEPGNSFINFTIYDSDAPHDVLIGSKPVLGNICYKRVI